MSAQPERQKPLVLILPDNTALCFDAMERRHAEAASRPVDPAKRIAAFVKSFLPKISRVNPINAEMPGGQRVRFHAPAAIN